VDASGVVRGCFSWISVPVLSGNLCMVLDENFDTEDGLFGAFLIMGLFSERSI
jgi:hypothetical protein